MNPRADSRLAPSQWETLHSNTLSHWLGANLESALNHMNSLGTDNVALAKQNTTKLSAHFLGYTIHALIHEHQHRVTNSLGPVQNDPFLYRPHNKVVGGGAGRGILVSVRPSVHQSVRPSRIPCPLCSAYSSGWILFIFIHLIEHLQKVCLV